MKEGILTNSFNLSRRTDPAASERILRTIQDDAIIESIMNAIIVIPSRWGSTRFPGKPLALIAGRSLIERVYSRATSSRLAKAVYVATDDERIVEHVLGFGGKVITTAPELPSGTDRIAASMNEIEVNERMHFAQIVNIQGDEPLIDVADVDRAIETLQNEAVEIVTLACPIRTEEEFASPDVVKVVVDRSGDALYFSRSPIPNDGVALARRHIGLYGYQAVVLHAFTALSPSPLERTEKLEQLRALENGYKIRVLETLAPHLGVDRPEDVQRIEDELARLHRAATEQ
jgi:3-deoxy-manno-octulosonate cytidylyltransferase (CMP-KDO synthetase)